jgi:hypothetical protein
MFKRLSKSFSFGEVKLGEDLEKVPGFLNEVSYKKKNLK